MTPPSGSRGDHPSGEAGHARPLDPALSVPTAHDVFHLGRHPLESFFAPRSVAVIGATEKPGSVGRTLLHNLISSAFGGAIYPVNPKHDRVLGLKSYATVDAIAGPIDLAVIVTPAGSVPSIIAACVARQVATAVIISAGFRETGAAGAALERQIVEEASRGAMRIIGPNCLGVMSPVSGLNATFAAGMARPGNVAFLSQSGALLTAILDWSLREQVGFSRFVSLGSMLDVGWGDLIDYLGDDPRTRAIVMYMESIGDARAFLSAAREVALMKPIIVIKAGRTQAASRAAASHTGALTGSDEVLDAAFRRAGVLRVTDIGEVFHLADVLGKQPRPAGPRLSIVTNAGGPAVLATDAVVAGGGQLAELDAETLARLNAVLPSAWSHANPVDILGDADPERFATALDLTAAAPTSDGLLAILTPQDMTDPTLTAEALRKHAHIMGKPVLASWMGGAGVAAGVEILTRAGIPTFAFPDEAARTFCQMWRYAENLRGLYETPVRRLGGETQPELAGVVINAARAAGRTLLDEQESKSLLASYGVPCVPTRTATSESQAVAVARELGFPVVLKLWSRTITHKSDVGGVKLGLTGPEAVAVAYREIEQAVTGVAGPGAFEGVTVQPFIDRRSGFELILGSAPDPQFGPVLLFGAGGELVEIFRDQAIALPPLNTTLARRLIERTRIHRALGGTRGRPPVDLEALAGLLVRFSELVTENPWIREIDVNPLLASGSGLVALDARVILHGSEMSPSALPRPAIRPYPSEHVSRGELTDGTPIVIRPIRPEDEPSMVAFHETLSEQSVRFRYLRGVSLDERTAHERLTRVCFVDYDREMALVVERLDGDGQRRIVALGRLSRERVKGATGAEFALVVGDPWQGLGVGRQLLTRLIEVAGRERIARIYAEIAAQNLGMQRLCAGLGFSLDEARDGVVVAERPI
ncbi:MAG TPA: bifunctional acetate--CoA ligase family protein/GNAT family N-acetyltransferase [Polyangia bacterium]|jgi:acetyltransferase